MRWSARHFLALLIAVSVTAGLGMSPVQASAMAAKMAMTADMAASGMGMPSRDGCPGCPDRKSDSSKMTVCPQACVAPGMAVLPDSPTLATVPLAVRLAPLPAALLHGWGGVPDPYPPRPFSFV